jgi:hypothetical protein
MSILLDRKALLKKQKLAVVQVNLGPDENGEEQIVFVREMTGRDRDNFEQSILKARKNNKGVIEGYDQVLSDFRAKLAVTTLCDAEGNLLLLPEDASTLSESISISKLEIIVEAAQKLNKITDKDKEELVKNSEAAPDGDSNSGSVENLA